MTPMEVRMSVRRWWASARSVIQRRRFPAWKKQKGDGAVQGGDARRDRAIAVAWCL